MKNTIKNILLREVGEATHRPFRSKRNIGTDNRRTASKEKDDFEYVFTTEKGFKYSVNIRRELGKKAYTYFSDDPVKAQRTSDREDMADFYRRNRSVYVNLKKMGAKREDFLTMWIVTFQVDDAPDSYFTEDGDYTPDSEVEMRDNLENENPVHYPGAELPLQQPTSNRIRFISTGTDINQGEFFRVMATVTKIIKDHVKKYGGRILSFSPADSRRGNIFTRYILKQMPGTKYYERNNDFYFLLNV